MKKLAYAAAVLGLVACSKTDQDASKTPKDPTSPTAAAPAEPAAPAAPAAPAEPAPTVVKGPQAAASDPSSLPPAGTAPAPVAVGKELDPIWNTPLKTLKGEPTTLAAYKGKALMLVNVASKCGNTPQYSTLEALQKKYAAKGFTVIGFPCNQFGGQEPGTAEQIQTFCSTTYGVTFPLTEKIDVNGAKRHSIYRELTAVADAAGQAGDIRWNFEKFVVSSDGKKSTRFNPQVAPDDPAVLAAIEAGLPR